MKKKKFKCWLKLSEKEIYMLARALENWERPERLVSAQEVRVLREKLETPIKAAEGELAILPDDGKFGPASKVIPLYLFFCYAKKHFGFTQMAIRLQTHERFLELIDAGTLMPGRMMQRRLWEIYALDTGKTMEEALDE